MAFRRLRTKNLFRGFDYIAVIFCVSVLATTQSQAEEPVGEVSLVLGEAYRLTKAGMREDIKRGSPISVGDQIKTLSNGHVHVRFADEALVSVRPNS